MVQLSLTQVKRGLELGFEVVERLVDQCRRSSKVSEIVAGFELGFGLDGKATAVVPAVWKCRLLLKVSRSKIEVRQLVQTQWGLIS